MGTFTDSMHRHLTGQNFLPIGFLADADLDALVRKDWQSISAPLVELFGAHFLQENVTVNLSEALPNRTNHEDRYWHVERALITVNIHPKGHPDGGVKMDISYLMSIQEIPTAEPYFSGVSLYLKGERITIENANMLTEYWDTLLAS